MALNITSTFNYEGPEPNFARDQFKWERDLLAVNPNFMDEGHISYCIETKKHYKWTGSGWEEMNTGETDASKVTIGGSTLEEVLNDKVNKSYVDEKSQELIGDAPESLNTLGKLSAALNNDEDFLNSLATKSEVNELSQKLNDYFWSQSSFSFTSDKTYVHTDTSNTVNLVATLTSDSIRADEINSIVISNDSECVSILKAGVGVKSISYSASGLVLNTGQNKTYYSKVELVNNGGSKTKSVTVRAYNKVYYGSSATVPTTSSEMSILAATNTVIGKTFSFTSARDGHAYYIMVPADVEKPTYCTDAGGVVQGFTQMSGCTINNVKYSVYRLGGAGYASGTKFTFITK